MNLNIMDLFNNVNSNQVNIQVGNKKYKGKGSVEIDKNKIIISSDSIDIDSDAVKIETLNGAALNLKSNQPIHIYGDVVGDVTSEANITVEGDVVGDIKAGNNFKLFSG